jgi:hypothetical protein
MGESFLAGALLGDSLEMGGLTDRGCSSSYHGYWAQDIWALNAAFGEEADLVELSKELHARGMVSSDIYRPCWLLLMGC